jgi:hypothetical protein
MLRRVTRISPWQAAKFCAVLYFIMGLIIGIPFALIMSATGQGGMGIGFAIAIPFGYAIGALIIVPIGCLVFNFVAGLVGGLEFTVTEPESA